MRSTREGKRRRNEEARQAPIVLSSDDEQAADVDSAVAVARCGTSLSGAGTSAAEAVQVKQELAEAEEEADAARWAEYGRLEAAARVEVKREVAGRRQREAEDGLEAVAVSVNLTGEMAAPGKFTITEEQKPCPICNHCVIINRGLQSNILHCGMGHCRVAGCLAQFCWDCGAIIDSARTTTPPPPPLPPPMLHSWEVAAVRDGPGGTVM